MRFVSTPILAALLVAVAAPCQGPAGDPASGDGTWWAYRPLQRPPVPEVEPSHDRWLRNPIDAFILARLEAAGITPSAPADRIAVLRRATYDLTGLPPTPQEVEAFLTDEASDAWERLIERLLASPQYGVKWGRHWLDLVRFAETDSYERDRQKPMAWRYRDYVVESFNTDKPYDRFLWEQLAGDELPDRGVEQIVATGYYRLGIWDDEPTDTLQAQYDDLDGIADTTARVMLGISMGCARCHDHKKDPIPQADYYRLLAFFENIKPYKEGGGNNVTQRNYVATVPADGAEERMAVAMAEFARRRGEAAAEVGDLVEAVQARLDDGERAVLDRAQEAGLVAHWTFDDVDGTRLLDARGAHHGEIVDATRGRPGRFGNAFFFDGGDDGVTVPRPVQDDFTISLWFQTDAAGSGRDDDTRWFTGDGLVDGEVPGIVRDFGIAYHSQGRVVAGVGRPERFLASPPGYNDGRWHHVAFTRSRSTGVFRLFVDGLLVGEKEGSVESLVDSPELAIGRLQPGNNHFKGFLDEVRVYDRELCHDEVLALCCGPGYGPAWDDAVSRKLGAAEAERHHTAVAVLRELRQPSLNTVRVLCVRERGPKPAPSFVRLRGNAHVRGEPVTPGFPRVVDASEPAIPAAVGDASSSGRRTELARWITSSENPLTARVMANRLWQYHFGRGIVRTPNDFGRLGELPTHPELLDWLAVELIERGWSLKAMHRLLMTSSAYRMASTPDPEKSAADPRNDLFWRFHMRRLGAEEIRDSILAVNGTLNAKLGGPGVYPKMPEEVLATASRPGQAWGRSSPEEAARRSIFIHVKRSLLTPLLTAFDMADTDASCPVRFATTQPTQALTMMNGEFLHEQADLFAERLRREAGTLHERIALGWRLCTSREPSAESVAGAVELIDELRRHEGLSEQAALADFCLVLLNLNEFVYLD